MILTLAKVTELRYSKTDRRIENDISNETILSHSQYHFICRYVEQHTYKILVKTIISFITRLLPIFLTYH